MRNTYSPWAELAQHEHLVLKREKPGRGVLGDYDHEAGVIRLDPAMPRRQARSVLCHELRHHEAGDRPTWSAHARLRQEFLADTRAARLLVDLRDLGDALVLHDQHQGAAAMELRVSLDVVRCRLKHLRGSEWEFLRGRLAGERTA